MWKLPIWKSSQCSLEKTLVQEERNFRPQVPIWFVVGYTFVRWPSFIFPIRKMVHWVNILWSSVEVACGIVRYGSSLLFRRLVKLYFSYFLSIASICDIILVYFQSYGSNYGTGHGQVFVFPIDRDAKFGRLLLGHWCDVFSTLIDKFSSPVQVSPILLCFVLHGIEKWMRLLKSNLFALFVYRYRSK